ncbi:MAG: insulinase family protein [Frankiaceae bacterium]|nr:insulinase family protein [Frankiaceae bacterium]MBV9369039.1 insulinase family protein [Frankiales bacterium]
MSLVAERPEAGPPRPWSFPSFERREVAGGRVIACHLPGKPLAVLELVADAGAVTEPAGKEGVAEIVVRALSEGAGEYDAYGFAVAGERLGASWRSHSDWDSLRCGFEVPVADLVGAAELLSVAVRAPRLEEASLQRVLAERVDEIRLDQSQPGPRAGAAFAAAVWAPGCRYSLPDGGTAETVAALTPDDVRRFHAARLQPDAVTLVIVGDLEAVDADAAARAVFEGWSGGSVGAVAPSPPTARSEGARVVVVDRPGSVQSMLYAGHDAPNRRTPDYVPMTTMGLVLGGMFNSRLNYRLREDKGYSYGAFGGFDARRDAGIFVARSAVQTEVTAPALADAVAEIRTMHETGATAEELEQARSYRAGVFPINFAGPGAVASGLADLVVHGLPDDHYDRLRQDVLDVKLDAVNAAAAQRLRPDDLVSVVVGDASVIADELRATGLGPVEVLADEN